VNWRHLQAFLWLRWRLRVNQIKRGGTVNAIITAVFAASLIPMTGVLFVGAFLVGLLAVPQIPDRYRPISILFIWDGMVLVFLFLWAIGLLSELQRSEVLSLDRFLHLPVSLTGVFLINYLSSLASVNLMMCLPAMLGMSLGLLFSEGPALLLLLPLLAAFLLAVTAVTYQFQGWLASLMVDQRRRRTIIAMVTIGFVLLTQLPNLINLYRPWETAQPNPGAPPPPAEANKEQEDELKAGKITAEEIRQRQQQAEDERKAKLEQELLRKWEWTVWASRLANLVLPPGWLPLGAMGLSQGDVLPALLGTVALTLIGTGSLWRSYRTTLRLYTGHYTARRRHPAAKAAPAPPTARQPVAPGRILFLERQLPGLSEQASVIALTSLRSLLRAPESKMMLLGPVIMLLVYGSMLFARKLDPPEPAAYLMAVGAMAILLVSMVQFIGNQFAFDRAGFRVFVLGPAPRRDILLGKNLAMAPLVLGPGFLMAVLVEVFYPMRADFFLALPVQMVTMYFLFCGLANWLSIFVPMPIASGGLRKANVKFVPALVVFLFISILPMALAPTLLPLGVAALLDWLEWAPGVPVCLLLSLPLCALVLYLYHLVLPWQGRVLQSREQTILTVVTSKAE
jgi:hypothetical protein